MLEEPDPLLSAEGLAGGGSSTAITELLLSKHKEDEELTNCGGISAFSHWNNEDGCGGG